MINIGEKLSTKYWYGKRNIFFCFFLGFLFAYQKSVVSGKPLEVIKVKFLSSSLEI